MKRLESGTGEGVVMLCEGGDPSDEDEKNLTSKAPSAEPTARRKEKENRGTQHTLVGSTGGHLIGVQSIWVVKQVSLAKAQRSTTWYGA